MHKQFIGTLIDGKYRVLSVLGEGGLGTVFKAEQPELGRAVALKLLHAETTISDDNKMRFEQEAKILASCQHKNIVAVYSFGLTDTESQPYMAMEYLEGRTLSSVLASDSPLPWKRAAQIVIQVCNALQYAHEHGIIHRDLKPQNIMIQDRPEPDYVKVLDFGLSKLLFGSGEAGQQKLTQTGALLGSVHYMAPELCLGHKAETSSDIYSLGCILYECLAGKVPLDADHPLGILHKHVNNKPDTLPGTVPLELQKITFKAMQKNADDRFESMQQFADALSMILAGREAELDLSSVKLDDAKARALSLKTLWIATLAFFGVVAIAAFSATTFKKPAELPTKSFKQLETRMEKIQKAKMMMQKAEAYMKQGKPEAALQATERALRSIAQQYPYETLTRELALADMEILRPAAKIIAATKPDNMLITDIDNALTHNDVMKLDYESEAEFYMLMALIRQSTGNYYDSFNCFTQGCHVYLNTADENPGFTKKAADLIAQEKVLKIEDPDYRLARDSYVGAMETRYFVLIGDAARAEKASLATEALLKKCDYMDMINQYNILSQLYMAERELGNRKRTLALLDKMRQAASAIDDTHPDRMCEYLAQRHNVYYVDYKDTAMANKCLKEWRQYVESLTPGQREDRFENMLLSVEHSVAEGKKLSTLKRLRK